MRHLLPAGQRGAVLGTLSSTAILWEELERRRGEDRAHGAILATYDSAED